MDQELEGVTVAPEIYFKIREYEVILGQIENDIDKLTLQKEKLLYEYQQLTQPEGSPEEEKPDEVKPKKLKKTNDQSSQNDTQV